MTKKSNSLIIVLIIFLMFFPAKNIWAEEKVHPEFEEKLQSIGMSTTITINDWFGLRFQEIKEVSDNATFQQQLEFINTDTDATAVDESREKLDDFIQDMLQNQYDDFSWIMVLDDKDEIIIWDVIEEIRSHFGSAETSEPNKDKYIGNSFVVNLPDTTVLKTDPLVSMESPQADLDNSHILLSKKITNGSGQKLGSLHYAILMDHFYELLVFKDESGTVDDEVYAELGLGESGEQYLVQSSTKKLFSLGRFTYGLEGVLEYDINTDGVNMAIEQGEYSGVYRDYRGSQIQGFSYLLSPTTTGTDIRSSDLKEKSATIDLGWVYVVEMDYAEIWDKQNNNSKPNILPFSISFCLFGLLVLGISKKKNRL